MFQDKNHYEDVMKDKVLPDIKVAEAKHKELQAKRQVIRINSYCSLFHISFNILFSC